MIFFNYFEHICVHAFSAETSFMRTVEVHFETMLQFVVNRI